jgi:hypothetical protein
MGMSSYLKNFQNAVVRFVAGLRRPTKAVNQRGLLARGEHMESFTLREVVPEDLSALAMLHVKTWADTYPNVKQPPSYELREQQWREQFQVADGSWFCFVVVNLKGELIGFAKGTMPSTTDPTDVSGQLSKIYLLREY